MLNNIKKKIVVELGHSNRLKITSTLEKFTSTMTFKSISPEWFDIFS